MILSFARKAKIQYSQTSCPCDPKKETLRKPPVEGFLYFIGLMLLSASHLLAQSNVYQLSGSVSILGEPVGQDKVSSAVVRLFVADKELKAESDETGAFRMDFSAPSTAFPLTVQVTHSKYETFTQMIDETDFQDGRYTLEAKLEPQKLSEVVVSSKQNKEKKSALLTEQKNSQQMMQSIGAAELQRKASANVSQGLVRMSGVTQVKERGLYVRGLDDRYNSLTVNDFNLSSPNPDNKIIPLDLIPSDIVKNISVYKTFNPQLHGDFVGATIDIETKDYPQREVFEVMYRIGYNSNSTFQNFQQLETTPLAGFTGFELGERQVPSVYDADHLASYRATSSESKTLFPTTWNNNTYNAPPTFMLGAKYGNRIILKNNNTIGYYVSLRFRNDYTTLYGVRRLLNSLGTRINDFSFSSFSYETQKSGLASFSYIIPERWQFTANIIYINNTKNTTLENKGDNAGLSISDYFSRDNTFEYNNLWAGQLVADYKLPNDKHSFKFGVAYSLGENIIPDRKLLRTERSGENARYITENGINPFVQSFSVTNAEASGYAKYTFVINDRHTIKAGYDLTYTQYKLFNRVISLQEDGAKLSNASLPSLNTNQPDDFFNTSYDSGYLYYQDPVDPSKQVNITNAVHALYVDYILQLGKLSVDVGVRAELTDRQIDYRDFTLSIFDPFLVSSYSPVFFMPSLNLKYKMNERSNLRFTASNTITRPRLREIIPVDYQDGNGNNLVGNEDLLFPNSYNVDLKYELFPTANELFSFTAFGKYIDNPIERIFVPISTGRSIEFDNFDLAYIAGIEHEADINLGRLLKTSWLKPFAIGYNVTWMFTQVSINTALAKNQKFKFLTETERPLQGASEWLANIDISYTRLVIADKWNATATLLFNSFSPRIFAVGVEGANNLMEQSLYNFDFVFQNVIHKRFHLTLTVKNILNTTILFTQRATVNPDQIDPTSYRTREGRDVTLTFAYGF